MDHNPFQIMFDEHDVIGQAEQALLNLEGLWNSDAEQYQKQVLAWVDFFRVYADQFHHHKEEKVLFPALMRNDQFMERGLVDELELQHTAFRTYIADAIEALNKQNYQQSYQVLRTYIDELMVHIGAENDELFIIAEEVFSESELENFYFQFLDIDNELGMEKKKQYEQFAHSMEND